MIRSHGMPFKWQGHGAMLYILRNDGYAWGRIVDVCGAEFDVNTDSDTYDMFDDDALEFYAELAIEHPDIVGPAIGWAQS